MNIIGILFFLLVIFLLYWLSIPIEYIYYLPLYRYSQYEIDYNIITSH